MLWFPVFSPTFKKRYKRKRKSLQEKVDNAIWFLLSDPDPKLFCRRKYGRLEGCYGYDLDDDNRILLKIDEEKREIHFLRVCTHRQVYGSF